MPRFAYVPGVVEQPEGTKTLYGDRNGDTTSYIPDEVYCNRDGRDLHFQLLVPRMTDKLNFHLMERNGPVGFRPDKFEPNPLFPLIVFIQGSAWMKQNCYTNLPRLARFARLGYAVASIEYRESTAAVWPAQLKDIKAAIRYLKANADIYGIDKNRVAIMGNSCILR